MRGTVSVYGATKSTASSGPRLRGGDSVYSALYDHHLALGVRAVGGEVDGEVGAVLVLARERVAAARDLDAFLGEFARHPVGGFGRRNGRGEAEFDRRLVGAILVVRVDINLGDRAAGVELAPIDVEVARDVEVAEIGEGDIDRGSNPADADLAAILAGQIGRASCREQCVSTGRYRGV